MPIQTSEFALIERIKERFAPLVPQNIEGIGDDCAIINSSADISTVMTADMLVEGVHFMPDIAPFDLGVRSVEVNISDIASMGARPTALLLSIALPEWVDELWYEQFLAGIESCAVPLIGGDTTRSKGGLCINITAIGEVAANNIKRRTGAKATDLVALTGTLGGSAASNYQNPIKAEVQKGVWLGARSEVGAMIDLSDGIAGDIKHLLKSSQVGATIELNNIPIAQGATLEQALSGGEDYKLLFTIDQDGASLFTKEYEAQFGYAPYIIGTINSTQELRWHRDGIPTELKVDGFKHF